MTNQQKYDRQRYLTHREEILLARQEHRRKNRDRLNNYLRDYYATHKDKARAKSVEYRRTHRQEIKRESAAYYQRNRTQILAAKQKYHQEHPECSVATRENRRARSKTAGRLTVKTVQIVYERNIKNHGTLTCYLCLSPIVFGQDSLEHKTPLSRGGGHEFTNLDVAHCSCNASKNNKTEAEYREYLKCLS